MNVLHLYRTYFPDTHGGLEETIRQICLNTKAFGVASKVLTLSPAHQPSELQREEATVHRAHLAGSIASCSVSFEAHRSLRELLPWADVVHYHFPWPFADALHLSLGVATPSVVTYHSDIVRQRLLRVIYRPLMLRFLRSVDRIVCTSPNYLDTSSVLQRFRQKVEVIPIGIDEASFTRARAEDLASTEALHGRDFFLFVGVLRYYKGLEILLHAAAGSPFKVVIAGTGPKESELKRLAAELGLDNLTFTGYVPDAVKASLFSLSRGVVFPSSARSEAFGVTLLEGAMHGKPLVSTEVGSGTSHVNVHGETGLVVAPNSVTELRDALQRLWQEPELAQAMGKGARRRYEERFTGAVMGEAYAELYRQLTSQGTDSGPFESTA